MPPMLSTPGLFRPDPAMPPPMRLPRLVQTWRYVTDVARLLEEGARQSDGAYTMHILGFGPVAVFTDEQSVKTILGGRPEDFGQANDVVAFFVGAQSIFLVDGDIHKHARRRTLAAFTGERMKGYGPAMKVAADRFIDSLHVGQTVSAMEAGTTMALEIILVALFGMERGPQYDALEKHVRDFMDGGHHPVASLMSFWLPAQLMRARIIGGRDPETMERRELDFIDRLLGRLPQMQAARGLTEALLRLVDDRLAALDDHADGTDGLSHVFRTAREEGHDYSRAAAFDECLTLLLAGHDTTAITLSRALYRLSTAPAVRDRLREELDEAFRDAPLDPARIERLPYLHAVVNECFRLDSLARGALRRLKRPMTIGGYALPTGTMVQAHVYSRQRDPERWQYPDDFRPEQFLGVRPKPHEFAPFGGGFRRCAGAAFATFELKVLLAQIVRRVDLCTPEGFVLEEGMIGPMIGPVGPVPVEIHGVRPEHG